jgi:hypothetical protein
LVAHANNAPTKSRTVTVCDACLTAACCHGSSPCDRYRTSGTTTRTVAELDGLGFENPGHYSAVRDLAAKSRSQQPWNKEGRQR